MISGGGVRGGAIQSAHYLLPRLVVGPDILDAQPVEFAIGLAQAEEVLEVPFRGVLALGAGPGVRVRWFGQVERRRSGGA